MEQMTEQQEAFKLAVIAGYMDDLARAKGGTGHKRAELSAKEFESRKKHRQVAKSSKKANR